VSRGPAGDSASPAAPGSGGQGSRGMLAALYQTLVEASDDIIFAIDREDRVCYVNPAAAALFGCAPEALIGRPRAELFPPAIARAQQSSLQHVFCTGEPFSRDNRVVYPTGSIWINTRLIPLRDAEGQVTMVLGVSRDLACSQEAAGAALRASEASYREIFNAVQDGVFVHDAATGEILDANQTLCELYGYTLEEVRGRHVGSFSSGEPPFTAAAAQERFRSAAAGEPQLFEWRVRNKSGVPFWVEVRLKCATIGSRQCVLAMVRDISERKKREERLRLLSSAVAQSSEGIAVADLQGRILFTNEAFAAMHGYHADEAMGRHLSIFHTPEQMPAVQADFRHILATGSSVGEMWHARRDGAPFPALMHNALVRNDAGEPAGVVATMRDITEQKAAEAALRASEARFRAIFEQASDGVVLYDARTREMVEFNDKATQIVGYPRDEFAKITIPDIEAVESPEEVAVHVGRIVEQGGDIFDTRLRTKGGAVRDVQVSARPITLGGRSFVLAIWRDVTEQRRAEEALRVAELQYRSTLDSLADAVHVVDTDLRLVLVNRSFQAWTQELGLSVRAAPGTPLFEVFPFLPPRVRDEYALVFRTAETLVTEETTHIDGREVITETRKIPILEASRVVRVVTVLHDITERRRLEAEALKAQRLDSIGLIAGGIAHDFNNLLTGVLTNLAVARQRSPRQGALSRALAEATRAALRAQGLTQRLLTFSAGGAPVRRPVALGPILRETADLVLPGSGTRCLLDIPDGLWPALADAQQIGQVFQNLLLNARQAMPGGGSVHLEARNFVVDQTHLLPLAEGRYLRVAVRDHGPGIPRELLPRIFEPFFSTKEGSTGLGLAASYAIVKKHKGCIEVQSEPGAGTLFLVYLPAADALPAPPVAEHAAPGRILLMDDDEIIRRGARRLLRDHGYEVECARDGAQAVELYAQAREAGQPFDAVILDLTVPDGMGGEECLRRLRALDPGVKAVVCSGYSDEAVLARYREHGFQAVVRKPYAIEELSAVLRGLIGGEAQ